MPRVKEITIEQPGRDRGKTFVLEEMPPVEGELWAMVALSNLERARGEKPAEDVPAEPARSLAAENAKQRPVTPTIMRALQDPQLEGMWAYVKFRPKNDDAPLQKLLPHHIEEWRTRGLLRVAYLNFLTDFFTDGDPSTSGSPSVR